MMCFIQCVINEFFLCCYTLPYPLLRLSEHGTIINAFNDLGDHIWRWLKAARPALLMAYQTAVKVISRFMG